MKRFSKLFLFIFAFFAFSMLLHLGRDLLFDWDECLYGQYAKEMVQSGHFLTNIWNGYIDLQKPPLYSWLLQLPLLFGRNEFTLRILTVFGALGIITSTYLFAKKYFSEFVAILSVLILLCAELFVIYSTKMTTDILYTLFIFLGVWSFLESKSSKKFQILSGVLFGLAIMVKGIGALQFLLALFAALFLNFNKKRLFDFIRVCAICAAVVIPWHLITYLTYGDRFIKVYIFDNIIKRSRYPIEFHRERIWFYFVLLYRELSPWIFAFFIFPITSFFNLLKTKKWEFKKYEMVYTILLLIIIPLASITRVQTRIAWYALPIYPFLAIYLAYNLDLLIRRLSNNLTHKSKTTLILYSIFIILLMTDAFKLITQDKKLFQFKQEVTARQEVIRQAKTQPQKELNYLVAYGERQAPEILPPDEEIDMTFVYGGHPCAVYYSDKKVNYFYKTGEFENALKTKRGLFLIENGDGKYSEAKKILYKNNDYTLFSN